MVCEAIKTAIYAQCLLELVGKKPIPRYCEAHNDIVTCFDAGTADALIGFCRGVQAASPVDSYAAPEPSPEPGYTDEVIMASGSFTQGSTIELSCDGPLREPYTGLLYTSPAMKHFSSAMSWAALFPVLPVFCTRRRLPIMGEETSRCRNRPLARCV